MKKIILSPSLMCGDLLNLGREINIFEKHSIDYLHIDIMDGYFVPNITFGFDFVNQLNSVSIPKDIHLMVKYPEIALAKIQVNRNDIIFFHIESAGDTAALIHEIKSRCQVGIAINNNTPVEAVYPYLAEIDFVCIMTIEKTGFAGQAFAKNSYLRVRTIAEEVDRIHSSVKLGVDGAVGHDQIREFSKLGVELFVLGTSSLYKGNIEENLQRLRQFVSIV